MLGDAEAIPVGSAAFARHLHGLVHHQGRRPDRREPPERGAPTPRAAEQREGAGNEEPRFGEVGEVGHPPQRFIHQGSGQTRHRSVEVTVVTSEAAQQ
jgi:hypothetical protein